VLDAAHFDAAGFDPSLPRYPTIVHALWAAEQDHPDGVALVCAEHRLSYTQLATWVRGTRDRLLELGAEGERVAILLPSSVEAVVAVLGAMAARAQAVPMNPFFSLPELRVALREAEPGVVLAGPDSMEKVAELASGLALGRTLEMDALDALNVRTFSSVPPGPLDQSGGPAVADPLPDDPALLIFTGGTTGEPKAVVHAHRSLVVSVLQHACAWPIELRRERFLSAAPIFHIWGLEYATFVPIYAQGTHVIVSKYDPDEVLLALERERITVFGGGPAPIYMGLTRGPRYQSTDFSSLKYCLTGGAPGPEELHRLW
jgi:long-chain acyl-CoA synthetase